VFLFFVFSYYTKIICFAEVQEVSFLAKVKGKFVPEHAISAYGRVSRSSHFDLMEITPGAHGVQNEN
jgi:hypothetical protein